jgi:hypothetical protein
MTFTDFGWNRNLLAGQTGEKPKTSGAEHMKQFALAVDVQFSVNSFYVGSHRIQGNVVPFSD